MGDILSYLGPLLCDLVSGDNIPLVNVLNGRKTKRKWEVKNADDCGGMLEVLEQSGVLKLTKQQEYILKLLKQRGILLNNNMHV